MLEVLTDPLQGVVTALFVLVRARDTELVSSKLFTVLRMVEALIIMTFLIVSPIACKSFFIVVMTEAQIIHHRFPHLIDPSFSFHRPLNIGNNFQRNSCGFLLTKFLVIPQWFVQVELCMKCDVCGQLSLRCIFDLLDDLVKTLSCLLLLLFLIPQLAQLNCTTIRTCAILMTVPSTLGLLAPLH